mmetsp:Transcript_27589/g.69640  ORF Transcript_27589/g.69640 Transcript_27589/m.69640 type:complete len:315 (+) Transcript_27589:241-1185(+)
MHYGQTSLLTVMSAAARPFPSPLVRPQTAGIDRERHDSEDPACLSRASAPSFPGCLSSPVGRISPPRAPYHSDNPKLGPPLQHPSAYFHKSESCDHSSGHTELDIQVPQSNLQHQSGPYNQQQGGVVSGGRTQQQSPTLAPLLPSLPRQCSPVGTQHQTASEELRNRGTCGRTFMNIRPTGRCTAASGLRLCSAARVILCTCCCCVAICSFPAVLLRSSLAVLYCFWYSTKLLFLSSLPSGHGSCADSSCSSTFPTAIPVCTAFPDFNTASYSGSIGPLDPPRNLAAPHAKPLAARPATRPPSPPSPHLRSRQK